RLLATTRKLKLPKLQLKPKPKLRLPPLNRRLRKRQTLQPLVHWVLWFPLRTLALVLHMFGAVKDQAAGTALASPHGHTHKLELLFNLAPRPFWVQVSSLALQAHSQAILSSKTAARTSVFTSATGR